jgi:hypothetical protein
LAWLVRSDIIAGNTPTAAGVLYNQNGDIVTFCNPRGIPNQLPEAGLAHFSRSDQSLSTFAATRFKRRLGIELVANAVRFFGRHYAQGSHISPKAGERLHIPCDGLIGQIHNEATEITILPHFKPAQILLNEVIGEQNRLPEDHRAQPRLHMTEFMIRQHMVLASIE